MKPSKSITLQQSSSMQNRQFKKSGLVWFSLVLHTFYIVDKWISTNFMWKELKTESQNSHSCFVFFLVLYFETHTQTCATEWVYVGCVFGKNATPKLKFPQGQLTLPVNGWRSSLPQRDRWCGRLRQRRADGGKLLLAVGLNKNPASK